MTFTRKPWGWALTLLRTRHRELRLLFVRRGHKTSDHVHTRRGEYFVSLPFLFPMGHTRPFHHQRYGAGIYLEWAYWAWDDDQIIRFDDAYGRANEGKVVAVSGGFDPVHLGHLYMFEEAKALAGPGGKLIAILNCDAWLVRKKGRAFMNQADRAKMVRAFKVVDEVYILESERNDVGEALERIRPHIFANGGDRRNTNDIPEAVVCEKYGIEMVFNVGQGGKMRSSSELLAKYAENGKS